MESDAFTLYKLIILFLLSKVDFPLTNAQILNIILDLDYTNYFNIQSSISELDDSNLIINQRVGNKSYYRITELGMETLSFFNNLISQAIQDEILEHLKKNQYSLRDEVSTLSEYFKLKGNDYMVRLRVIESNEPIIDLNITVPSEDDAISICNNWENKSQQVYAYILTNLLKRK